MKNTAEKIYTLPKELWLKLHEADCNPCRDNYYPLIEEIKNEVQRLDDHVHKNIINPLMRLQFISDYVNDTNNLKHRLNEFIPEFISDQSHVSIMPGEVRQELNTYKNLFQYWQDKKAELFCNEYNENSGYCFYTHGLLITLIGELYDRIKKYECDPLPLHDTPKTEAGDNHKKEPDKKPLAEKINWKAGEDLLRTHLEKLREHKFIDYAKTDSVMSGDKIAVFIKHKTYIAINQNILALYDLWNEKNFISDYIDREGKRQYKEFMQNVFNWDYKGEIKNIKHGSMGTLQDRERKKIIEIKKHLESILI